MQNALPWSFRFALLRLRQERDRLVLAPKLWFWGQVQRGITKYGGGRTRADITSLEFTAERSDDRLAALEEEMRAVRSHVGV